ncbi:hypothetical protein [Gemmata sp.]|uniref:hypothetical protein n=1 Tax=Gemmata sp. TaxID=1914242 RepID=UPI003F6F7C9C
MNATEYEAMEARRAAATKAAGYDYAESRLTAEEMARADAGRVRQYERGIITGGELDCLVRTGRLPG